MAEGATAEVAAIKASLRRSIKELLAEGTSYRGVRDALREWGNSGCEPLLFGGFVRDLVIFGKSKNPRDVDVVMAGKGISELKSVLATHIQRENRFGGLQIEMNRCHFDVWALGSTWAFTSSRQLSPTRQNLPKTTFLNVEAIAISFGTDGAVEEIYEHGFFDAIVSRRLDINFEENPFPALAAVRSLITALGAC